MSEINCTNPVLQSPLNIASGDKFVMVLNLPYVLRKRAHLDESLNIKSLQMSIHGTIVPAISVPPIEARYSGQSINVSSHSRPNYPPLTVNFIIDNGYSNYYVLWKWLELLNDPLDSTYGGTPLDLQTKQEILNSGNEAEYQTTFSIFSLNEYNEQIIEFRYNHAFITNLGGINYSYREGTVLETTAEFQFNQLSILKLKK